MDWFLYDNGLRHEKVKFYKNRSSESEGRGRLLHTSAKSTGVLHIEPST